MKKFLSVSAFLLASAAFVSGAQAVDFPKQAKVKIIAPITMDTGGTDLNFGTVVKPAAQGTIRVTAAGVKSVTGGLESYGTTEAANYTVNGDSNTNVSISVVDTGGTAGLALSDFDISLNDVAYTGATTISPTGSASLKVGATLTVDPTVATGEQTRDYRISIAYE